MPQVFPSSANFTAWLSIVVLLLLAVGGLGGVILTSHTPYNTDQGVFVNQPVPFSHKHHVKGLGLDNVEVVGFNSLLVKFARSQNASVIIRGLRAVADFEYEYQMAGMNQQLDDNIETVFLMADVALQPIASKLVKEIALYGGDITPFVSLEVRDEVNTRVQEIGRKGDL